MRIEIEHIDLEQIERSGQCFRWQRMEDGGYRIPAWGRTLAVRQTGKNMLELDCTRQEWRSVWYDYFDAGTDYGQLIAQIDPEDAYLTAAAAYAGGVRMLRQPLWEMIVSAIVSQNNNIPRIQTILRRLCGGALAPFPAAEEIAALGEEGLRACGAGYRAPYLMDAARRFSPEEENALRAMRYEQARLRLMEYRGIGGKVADCICLFALGHREAFPMDVWMKRILAAHYPQGFPFARYGQSAGIMQQYMFYYERMTAQEEKEKGRARA